MNFKKIRLNEKNWTEKIMYYIIYFILQSGKGKTKQTETDSGPQSWLLWWGLTVKRYKGNLAG